mmetsp:Transcript_18979/g.49826  ORF Transcript_18979/g.49826 Transcript_18979/m.49826 type:complete len:114 (+) Transcript_18979:243-584(+)
MTKPELTAYKTKKQHDWNMTVESGFSSLAMTIMYLFCFNELYLNGTVEDHWAKCTVLSTHAISLVREGPPLPVLLPSHFRPTHRPDAPTPPHRPATLSSDRPSSTWPRRCTRP